MLIARCALLLAAAMPWLGLGAAPPPASGQEPGNGTFERFRYSFFEDQYSARDGLDLVALRELRGNDRQRAEDMLLAFLPDSRAVIGLGELHSQRAASALTQLFEDERKATDDLPPYQLIFVTKALWQIQPDSRWLQAMADILTSHESDMARQEAAESFAAFHHPDAIAPLVRALDDPESLVRHHAARALLTIHGLADDADMRKAGSESLIIRVMAGHPPRRDEAKRDLLTAIAGRPIATP